ncbi:DUF488 domain-containing protein ['Paenibacillus yunnanensis' Narsing Rao et al. 2020]|uniref:DUF488 domain-containing protein n=1 Tax=Paenibacillus tengchongensis TaxID=2608684 RepID=UPI00124C2C7E|nr:DUF488 domain-containing protein [Paenibacillus tengchongensis]
MDGISRSIGIKRIYEEASAGDGCRILVDRLWPRGVSREAAAVGEWMKEIAPSPELRKWFGHVPERFPGFRERYRAELEDDPVRQELAGRIQELAAQQPVTLLYGAKDPVHNHAALLREWLLSG